MGTTINSCSNCIKDLNLRSDVKVENNNLVNLVEEVKSNQKTLKYLIKIQSFFKMILVRKQIKAKLRVNHEKRMLPEFDPNCKFKIVKNETTISDIRLRDLLNKLEPLNDHVKVSIQAIEYENESIYYGEWNNYTKQKHGRGIKIWACESVYEGYWKNNKANGYGVLYHKDGDKYEGEWLDNKANGNGIYTHKDGSFYEGQWVNDKQHGKGKESWADGALYEGNFKDGYKSGHGYFTWSDGCTYIGEFYQNNIHGKGQYTWNDKRSYHGEWKNNKMNGKGEFTWPDGRRYFGDYKDDKKEGNGEFKWADGKQYKGNWANGKQHGEGQYYNPKEGIWRRGRWNEGIRTEWVS